MKAKGTRRKRIRNPVENAEAAPGPGVSPEPQPTAPLNEDAALTLLERRHLSPETLERLGQEPAAMKSRKVCVAIAAHPRAPRHLALRLLRHFYTLDLMRFALRPAVAADLKHFAAMQLVTRLPAVTLGERLMLARRSSETVAAALLLDQESRVSRAALDNARLTEAAVIRAILRPNTTAAFVEDVCRHPKWSLRREIRQALLHSPHTPLGRALEFARNLAPPLLRDILHTSQLPDRTKTYLKNNLKKGS